MTGKKQKQENEEKDLEEQVLQGTEVSSEPVTDESEVPMGEESGETAPADHQEKLSELNDKYLRLYSEFDNYRKRTLRERIELSKTASADVIASLLPVLDDFERALKAHSSDTEHEKVFHEGISLIYNKLLNALIQKGLEQMITMGEPFNTDRHEAVANISAPDPELLGKVVDEVEKGYLLNGKVIRYAKVVVGS
jgi:molecular chaperone GrpE